MVKQGVEDMTNRLPETFNMVELEAKIVDKNPYVVCMLQEVTRMNGLVEFIRRSLEELTLGLEGSLNMSEAMEQVLTGIATNKVPPSWMAQMSTRVQEVYSLDRWFKDVLDRQTQLEVWTDGKVEEYPKSVWLPGLFNAKAFITSVQQVYARANGLPLDVMKFMTDVTTRVDPSTITEYPPESAYVHGLTLEGARWSVKAGKLQDSQPGELRFSMPVIRIVPVTFDKYTTDGYYVTPVYMNMQRANVYSAQVSNFTLKTADNPDKWTLASVALLLQDELGV